MPARIKELTDLAKDLAHAFSDARQRELDLIADLTDEQLVGPSMRIVEPPIWELGHVGWFQERWILRHLDDDESISTKADQLYDSFNIPNTVRWDLLFPPRSYTLEYINTVLERVLERLKTKPLDEQATYFYRLAIYHEDMHTETLHHIRQTLRYPRPQLRNVQPPGLQPAMDVSFEPHDVEIPGGLYQLGATPDIPFVWDNEKWAYPIEIPPFKISATPVTVGEYVQFVEAGGYKERSIWSDEGWAWRTQGQTQQPIYWQRDTSGWTAQWFDQTLPLQMYTPIMHINWYEANAYATWAGRRLPTEAEWELAASGEPTPDRKGFTSQKRHYPWGNQAPNGLQANLDSCWMGPVDVRAFPEGDSAFGCRQMVGNAWEWTADTFDAFPGFELQPYKEYSEPSFKQQKVLRGGCWATRGRLIRNTFRNFYTPDRNNIFAGFRTVAM